MLLQLAAHNLSLHDFILCIIELYVIHVLIATYLVYYSLCILTIINDKWTPTSIRTIRLHVDAANRLMYTYSLQLHDVMVILSFRYAHAAV